MKLRNIKTFILLLVVWSGFAFAVTAQETPTSSGEPLPQPTGMVAVIPPTVVPGFGLDVYFSVASPDILVETPFTLDLYLANSSTLPVVSLTVQCMADRILFILLNDESVPVVVVDPLATPTAVDPLLTVTPEVAVFGANPSVLPFTIDTALNTVVYSISQTDGNPAIVSGKVHTFNLFPTTAGTFTMTCNAILVDVTGVTSTFAMVPLTMNIYPTNTILVTPSAETTEVVDASLTETPIDPALALTPTVEGAVVEVTATETPIVDPNAVVGGGDASGVAPTIDPALVTPTAPTGSITGTVFAGSAVTVTIFNDTGFTTSVNTAPDGTFVIANVPTGFYNITADAKYHLPAQGSVGLMPNNVFTMSTITLVAGDLNDDNLTVDNSDIALLNFTYDASSPLVLARYDLDHDGSVGLGDLNIVATNMGQIGPILWQ